MSWVWAEGVFADRDVGGHQHHRDFVVHDLRRADERAPVGQAIPDSIGVGQG